MIDNSKEYILCAAIWYKELVPIKDHHGKPKNIDKGFVLCGRRHHDIIGQMCATSGLRTVESGDQSVGKFTEGFLTSRNRFVDRLEAALLAYLCGQITQDKAELYSEDIY